MGAVAANDEMPIRKVEKYWDTRPCNILHSPSKVGSLQYFKEVEERKYFVEPHIPNFAEFKKWKGKKVLEIGCGIGTDAANFAEAGADYTGTDLSSESLKIAQRRFKTLDLKGKFFKGNAEELKKILPYGTYDLVYSFGVIHHTPYPEKVVNAVKYFMEPESEFRLMLYSKYSWKRLMILLGLDQPEAQSGCPIAKCYSFGGIRKLLKDYHICGIRKEHIFPFKIDSYKRYQYEIVPWFKWMPSKCFTYLERQFGWHTLIRCKLKK